MGSILILDNKKVIVLSQLLYFRYTDEIYMLSACSLTKDLGTTSTICGIRKNHSYRASIVIMGFASETAGIIER